MDVWMAIENQSLSRRAYLLGLTAEEGGEHII